MVKTFEELKDLINAAGQVIAECEKQKPKYIENKTAILNALNEIKGIYQAAIEADKRAAEDESKDVDSKVKDIIEKLKEAKTKYGPIQTKLKQMSDFLETTLQKNIQKAATDVFQYRQFRRTVQQELAKTKTDLAIAATQLKAYLKGKGSSPETIGKIDKFLSDLSGASLYEMNDTKKAALIDSFENATDSWGITSKGKAKKGVYTTHIEALTETLEHAVEYSTQSGECWAECHNLRDKLDKNKYINEVRTELGVVEFEESKKELEGDLQRLEERLKARISRYWEGEKGEKALEKINAMKIPQEIDWLKKAYGLSQWAYENLGETVGEKIGLPQEASFEFKVETPEVEASVSIPVYHCGVASVNIDFSASVGASASIGGKLTLHNFLSASEPNFVSGELNASAGLTATASVGVSIVLIELIKAGGQIVIEGSLTASMNGKAELLKANIEGYPSFDIHSDAGIEFKLIGYLEAYIGLTPTISKVIKKITGEEPKLSIKTDEYEFFKASRTATLSLELPLKEKPKTFPKDKLKLSSGEWEVNFIAKEQLTNFWNDHFGGRKNWKKIQEDVKLTKEEIDELTAKYSDIGERV